MGNLFLELLIKPKRKVSVVGLASVGVGVLVVVWEMFGVELQAVVKIKKQDIEQGFSYRRKSRCDAIGVGKLHS